MIKDRFFKYNLLLLTNSTVSIMTTIKDIEQNHNAMWLAYCKTTIKETNMKETSDLYKFISNMFLILVKYYNKDRSVYNTIYKFLCFGNNFTSSLKETLMKFFRNVMKDDEKEKHYKNLFKIFRSKTQREKLMKTLHEKLLNLINSQQCIVHVKTETAEDNKKEYAREIIKNNILHQKELQIHRNELAKRDDTIKHLLSMLAEKDKTTASKDQIITNLQNDNLMLKNAFQALTNHLNK